MSRPLLVSLAHLSDTVWRADALACASGDAVATGHPALDAQLPGGGWPVGAVCEILQAPGEHGEWRLLLPALVAQAACGRAATGPVVLVGAPQVPFGPGLAAQGLAVHRLLWVNVAEQAPRLWASEQALRCTEVAAVLVWLPQVRAEQLRRLQIAASAHAKLLFVMRPALAQTESSPAVLRLLVTGASPGAASGDALQVHILKRRGPPLAQGLLLAARAAPLRVLLALSERPCREQPFQATPHRATPQEEGRDALDCLAATA